MKIEEKIEEIRKLVKEINSYDDLLFMYEGDRIDLECTKYELWALLQDFSTPTRVSNGKWRKYHE